MYKYIEMYRIILFLFQALMLNAQDNNYTEWYLQREDVDIFVKEIGSKKDTVIVVHGGFGANHDYLLDAVKGLTKEFHFIFYDQRGSLMSPTAKENLSFQKNVDDLNALVLALQLKKVKILCHSMGTLIGMEFVKQHPEKVSHLVLTGALLPKSDSIESVFSKRQQEQVNFMLNRKIVTKLSKPYKLKGIDQLNSIQDIKNSTLSHKDLTDFWRLKFAAVNIYKLEKYHLVKGGRAYYNPQAAIMTETVNWNYDYRDILSQKTKTTIINGSYDFLDFDSLLMKTLLKKHPKIKLISLANAGHNSWIDQPELFKKHLKNGLK